MKAQFLYFLFCLILLAPMLAAAEDVLIEFTVPGVTAAPEEEAVWSSGGGIDDVLVEGLPTTAGTAPALATNTRILIYHSHTHEAYEMTPERSYRALSDWRTLDESANMVAVGAALCDMLRARGHTVTHDRTDYEQNDLSSAYARSLEGVQARIQTDGAYDLYLDLHRDSYSKSSVGNVVMSGGERLARLMCLVGTGEGQTGAGFDQKPNFAVNNAFAQRLTDRLNAEVDALCRSVCVKTGRFNQHVGPLCLLIEVGNNRNTLDEAILALPYLADAITDELSARSHAER